MDIDKFYSIDELDAAKWALKKIREEAAIKPAASDEIKQHSLENIDGFVITLWKDNRPVLVATGMRTAFNGTAVVLCRTEWD